MIPEFVTELLDIAADRVQPTLTQPIVVQTKPTSSLTLSGWAGQHGILVPQLQNQDLPRRVIRIGVVGTGWATVEESIVQSEAVKVLKDAYGSQPFPAEAAGEVAWALEANGCVYFPIRGWDLLPAHMTLSQYDRGHRVLVTRGEAMGAVGQVTGFNLAAETAQVKLAKRGEVVSVALEALAVLLDDDPAKLAPMSVLYPPGTPVWASVRVRANQPLAWTPATATVVVGGALRALRQDTGEELELGRDEVVHGDEPEPAPGPPANTAKGYRPAGRVRKKRDWNVPPAKR